MNTAAKNHNSTNDTARTRRRPALRAVLAATMTTIALAFTLGSALPSAAMTSAIHVSKPPATQVG
jgi:hypothetical protein